MLYNCVRNVAAGGSAVTFFGNRTGELLLVLKQKIIIIKIKIKINADININQAVLWECR